jgi:hypothetical protein
MLPIKGMTPQEIRVLQEFRRLTTDTLSIDAIKKIKHPVGGGEAPAFALLEKGYVTADGARENFTLTGKAKEFLSYDPLPGYEKGGADAEA